MSDAVALHEDQLAYWNGPGGAQWMAQQTHTDAVLAPVAEAVVALAAPAAGERVLDIGCGCGASTLLLAARAGHVTGLDVSAPMLDVARQRGAGLGIDWVLADAATYAAPLPFDLLASRFGVMFFGDPTAAFANLRRAARPGARLVFASRAPTRPARSRSPTPTGSPAS
jgi:ubiquinone/menaquinone biosynthesis C-methylase UbiE